MKKYLKSTSEPTGSVSIPQKASLDFARLETDIPELWVRVVIIRSRVKKLSDNFDRDARKALKWFHIITGGTAVLTIFILWLAVRLAPVETGGDVILAVTVVVAGTVAAILASAANALGAGKRASSMFAAKWSMRALELSIDQKVHMIAIDTENGKLTPALLEKVDAAVETWITAITQTLNSFGLEYGKSLGPIIVPELKLPDIK